MRTKERIREVNDVVGDRVKREAVKVAGLAPSAELVRTLARDEDVRAAAREVLSRAEKLRGELSHGGQVGRLARDPKLQNDVAALIRSTAGALDAGVSAGKRRARRRVFRFLLVGSAVAALGVWLNKKRQEGVPWHQADDTAFSERSGQGDPVGTGVRAVHPVGTGAAMTGSSGNGTTAANGEGQSKPTPAASAERVETDGPTG
jgi:hypothetical protein